jgi:hypothetical protein
MGHRIRTKGDLEKTHALLQAVLFFGHRELIASLDELDVVLHWGHLLEALLNALRFIFASELLHVHAGLSHIVFERGNQFESFLDSAHEVFAELVIHQVDH